MKRPSPRVLIIVHVKDTADIAYRCIEAIHGQDCQDFSLMIHEMKPVPLNDVPAKNKTENVTRNRNHVRPMAFASGAEWILWVDSDVVLPPRALSDLLDAAKDSDRKLLGGWYKKINGAEWVAGRWTAPNVMRYFTAPQEGIIEADLIGIGCSLMHRKLLEKLAFRSAVQEYHKDEAGNSYYVGNCLSFCEDARRLGFRSYLVGSVVCEHLVPPRTV